MSRIEELYEKYFRKLVRRLGRNPDAEDITQDMLIRQWLRPTKPENELAYLAVSVRREAGKRARRAAERRLQLTPLEDRDALSGNLSPETETILAEERARLRARIDDMMAGFSPETRHCLALDRHGLGPKAIAEHLPLTYQAVRTRLSRAKRLLAEAIRSDTDAHRR